MKQKLLQEDQEDQEDQEVQEASRRLSVTLLAGVSISHFASRTLLLKYSNFQQIYKKLSQFYKKNSGLIRLKVASNPTLPKGQKPK